MTTIAWDGKTLAGDKQVTTGGTATRATKVFKLESNGSVQYLVGFSGDLADGQAFVSYARNGFTGPLPKFNALCAIVIGRDRSVICYHNTNEGPANMGVLDAWALGSGSDYALGAMAFGANAVQAVEVSTKLDVNTGMGIDTVTF